MSEVIDPPEFYFTGINFNPAFYAQDTGSGISEAEANALYLRKTVADTATAQETFTAGIVTPSVTSTGALNIVVPAVVSTDILNVGVVTRDVSGQVHHYSDGDNCVANAGVHLNNGINNGSNTNIMNGTNTTGNLNLMTGGNATGTVNIMTAASSGNVNIKTGNNSTGTISIGQQNATSFTTTTIDGDVNIASQTGADNTINIGKYGGIGFVTTTNIDGDVNIGLGGGEINAQNLIAYTLTTDTIFGPTTDAYMEIGRDITTGPAVGNLAIAIGQELTTGKVEIGKNQTTGTITLGSGTTDVFTPGKLKTNFIRAPTTSGITYINDDATGAGCTILGSAGTRTKVAGILETSSIRTPATNGSLAIAGDQTSGGTVNIGSVFTTTTFSGPVQATGLIGFAKTGSANTFTETNTFTNATAGIKVNKITSDGTASSLTIAGDQTAGGTVAIGSASTITTMNGTTTMGATTVLGTTNINATGGANTTIGTVVTGTTTLRGSTVDVTCSTLNLTGGTTVLGTTNINATGAQSTTIGQASGNLTMNGLTTAITGSTAINVTGPTNINTTGTSATAIGNSTGTLTMNGGTYIISGSSSLPNNYLRGQNLNIGDEANTNTNIGTGVLGATNYVSIASNGSNNATSYLSLGGDSLGTTYFRSKTIDINGNGAGNTSIGSTLGTGTITLYKPITTGYVPSALTSTSMIGGRITSFPTTSLALNQSTGSQVITSFTLPVGVWICSFQVQYASSVSTTFTSTSTYMFIGTPTAGESLIYGSNRNFVSQTTTPSNILILSGSGTITNTTSQTISLVDESRYTTASGTLAVNNPSTYLIATRIA